MINSFEDLQKLFELCRLNRVTSVEVAGVKVAFDYAPVVMAQAPLEGDEENGMPPELKGDDLIFYSSVNQPGMEG